MKDSEHYLAEEKLRITEADGTLWLLADGQKVALGNPRRALPLSHPDEFIVLNDRGGAELGVVLRVASLEPKSRALLNRALGRAYAITEIRKVFEVERDAITGQVLWKVEVALGQEELRALAAAAVQSEDAGGPLRGSRDQDGGAPAGPPASGRRGRFRLLKRPADADVPGVPTTREMEFTIGGTEDVQTARYPPIYIHDTDGHRYEILNCEELELESRRAAERYF